MIVVNQATTCVRLSRRRSAAAAVGDAGFSLVEIAVYIVLLGIISSIVVAVVLTSFQAERVVSSTTSVSNSSQNFMSAFDRDVRNASLESVTASKVVLRVWGGDATRCRSLVTWEFSGSQITRQKDSGAIGKIVDAGVSDGVFSAVGSQIKYKFTLTASGTKVQTPSGVSTLSPAGPNVAIGGC